MVFPGQGSQSIGMMAAYGAMPEIRDTLAEASEVLKQDIAKLMAEGPAEELGRTVNTQPVMVTAGYAAYRAWRSLGGPEPDMVAGHSLGEYAALVVAGVLSFADCLPLVRLRARAMQQAVPEGTGAMAAVLGLEDQAVREACAEAAQGEVVEAVNFNAPGQVVIAGHAAAVKRGVEAAKARGAKRAVLLPVSAPFHSSLMAPAARALREALAVNGVLAPRIPVIHNVDAAPHAEPDGIRDALYRQAFHPVLWSGCIRTMAASAITHVYECGPGKVLGPLSRRIVGELRGGALADRSAMDLALQTLTG
ncbi:MAG: [acyl-carrier-protein] S-malonyltransferase [Betaproteobacteria bacterium RBG_16_64_9]|nr:MAG: [acyl-carrier-protein] S-malonyltransferase [Betaproteobacteria bacterium RBG_16_64_9]OGA23831.1 MAG: [acyl-carrier-protein] S-malonyltransferase [Betaproteobacteria bacterium RIFCSPLOWO2_02_FULL_65_24]OGA95735.1 MAG: [acyl-carrier-protein] S-malonyltransferase [Betaproteobacteria bacterium RIFCSPLOWO2_12_FULL_66_14]